MVVYNSQKQRRKQSAYSRYQYVCICFFFLFFLTLDNDDNDDNSRNRTVIFKTYLDQHSRNKRNLGKPEDFQWTEKNIKYHLGNNRESFHLTRGFNFRSVIFLNESSNIYARLKKKLKQLIKMGLSFSFYSYSESE